MILINKKNRFVNLFILTLSLNACAPRYQDIPRHSLEFRTRYLQQLHTWQVKAKVAISNGKQGHNISIHWQQEQDKYRIQLSGPLGSGSATITGTSKNVLLMSSDGQKYIGSNAETLVLQHMGWDLPFTGLIYWIKGLAAPSLVHSKQTFDQYKQLQTLQQAGWFIDYQGFSVYNRISLPTKIILTKDTVKIKIIINDWQI